MVEVDAALVVGAAGILVGAGSLVYAHTQATLARRQAEAAVKATEYQRTKTMTALLHEVRATLMDDRVLREGYVVANADLMARINELGGFDAFVAMRNMLDALQDVWVMRRDGVLADHTWRLWTSGWVPILRMDLARLVFESAARREAYDPGFIAAMGVAFERGGFSDPLTSRARP